VERALVAAPDGEVVLAVDVGGTKLAAGLVAADGSVLTARQCPTVADDGDALFATLAGLCDEVLAGAAAQGIHPARCGVGSGGPMARGGDAVSPVNIPQWRNFPLRSRLAAHLGLSVVVDNDAKALALAEGWRGAAVGESNYLAMVVSTGVGGGLVLDGRLVEGNDGNAGHVGHVIVEPDGHLCGCGARGCLEAEASGTAIARITGRPPAEAGPDEVVRVGTLVGRAVASVANLCDLHLAVVAGSVALGFGEPFFAAAQGELDRRCQLAFSAGTRIRPGGLGASGPLIGAACVAWAAHGGARQGTPGGPGGRR
jgi:glucokinase